MNFLADESCTGPVLRALREAGHDVVAIAEVARGATDEQVLERALGHVPHLRCSAFLYTTHPALTRWAKVCRAYGAGTRPSRHGAEEGHGVPAAGCRAPTRMGAAGGACRRRDLSR